MDLVLLAFAAVVALGYTVQTVTGFGSMLVCVTLGAQLLPIQEVIVLTVPISLLQTGTIAIRDRDAIDWRLLLVQVLPLMGLGLVVCRLTIAEQPGDWMRIAFGVLVLILSVRELVVLWRARLADGKAQRRLSRPAHVAALLGAGVVHGLYATGGPLLVYAVGRGGHDKRAFRSTLSVVWFVLNAALSVIFLVDGHYDGSHAVDLLWLAPAVPVGLAVGELLHHRVDERRFKITVFALLVLAALSLILR